MVQKKGGNKQKKQKKVSDINDSRPLSLKDISQLQEYAQIVKAYGNGRFEANCFDGKTRLAHARGSLKKKKIFVKAGDVVLISLREFEDNKCDVLHVYNLKEIKDLKKLGEIPANISEDALEKTVEDDGFDFIEGDEDEKEEEKIENLDDIFDTI